MEYIKTLYSCENGIARITMNYPKNLNAIDVGMALELLMRLESCEKDPHVKVVIIDSAIKAFSAGGDIGFFYEQVQSGGEVDIDELIRKVGLLVLNMKRMSKMIITSVGGAAAGAGANLALFGDFVICAENVKFIQAFINLGLVPDTAGTYLLSSAISMAKAMELCATGKPLPAADALSLGLVTEVCAPEQLQECTMAWANKLAAGPLVAYGCLKKEFFEARYKDLERYLSDGEQPAQRIASGTEDFKEGVCAFMEKRKPHFQGK